MDIKQIRLLSNSTLIFLGNFGYNISQITSLLIQRKFNTAATLKESVYFVLSVIIPVLTIAVSLGVVIGIQMGPEFADKGIANKLGILSALTMTRELMPVVGSLMIATQYGTGLAAELANMKITEQVDALEVFQVNPIEYLVLPRFLAVIVFMPFVIWLAVIVSVASSFVSAWFIEDIRFNGFMGSIWQYLKIKDVLLCLIKSSIFGGMIVLIASTLGLDCKGGAKEVGKATTMTVIITFIAVVVVDYIITSIYL